MSSMLRQHHVKIQDLVGYLRGFDPSKSLSAEEWSKLESATFEPGMLMFCLERVAAPQGLAFGKRDDANDTYRVRDLCVVVGHDNNRPLVVNITASAFELRFLEVLLQEKARKSILDGKDFLYVSAQPTQPLSDAKIREIEQLGAVYAQGGSRRSLVVDGAGPQEPATALLGAMGVKLSMAGIGKQVLDIGAVCHMLFTSDARPDDRNKTLVKQTFTPLLNTARPAGPGAKPASTQERLRAQTKELPSGSAQTGEPVWQNPIPSTVPGQAPHSSDLYTSPPTAQQAHQSVDDEPAGHDLKFSFERTEISTDPSTWQQQQSGQGYMFPPQIQNVVPPAPAASPATEQQAPAASLSDVSAVEHPGSAAPPMMPEPAPESAEAQFGTTANPSNPYVSSSGIPAAPPSSGSSPFQSSSNIAASTAPETTQPGAAPSTSSPEAQANFDWRPSPPSFQTSEGAAPNWNVSEAPNFEAQATPFAEPQMPWSAQPAATSGTDSNIDQFSAPSSAPPLMQNQADTGSNGGENSSMTTAKEQDSSGDGKLSLFERLNAQFAKSFQEHDANAARANAPVSMSTSRPAEKSPFAIVPGGQWQPPAAPPAEPPAAPEQMSGWTPAASMEARASAAAAPQATPIAPTAPEAAGIEMHKSGESYSYGYNPELAEQPPTKSAAADQPAYEFGAGENETFFSHGIMAKAQSSFEDVTPYTEPSAGPETEPVPMTDVQAPHEEGSSASSDTEAPAQDGGAATGEMAGNQEDLASGLAIVTQDGVIRNQSEPSYLSQAAPFDVPAEAEERSMSINSALTAPEPVAQAESENSILAAELKGAANASLVSDISAAIIGSASSESADASAPIDLPLSELSAAEAAPATEAPSESEPPQASPLASADGMQTSPSAVDSDTTLAAVEPATQSSPDAVPTHSILESAIDLAPIPAAVTSSTPPAIAPVTAAAVADSTTSQSGVQPQNNVFQEPKLVMSEMTTLMNRLEQQVGKAGKKLNARAEEIKQRLNAAVAQLISEASEVERNSQNSITSLTGKMAQRLDEVSEEARQNISDVASTGRYTIKQQLQTNQGDVEESKTELYESLRDVCSQFRVDTATLTRVGQERLKELVNQRTQELEELAPNRAAPRVHKHGFY